MERKRKCSHGIPYHGPQVTPNKRHESDRDAKPRLAHHQYTVGWICAIATEYAAAQEFLDEEHAHPHNLPPNDGNHYTFGRIGPHNVVMAVLAEYGIAAATAVAMNMQHSFPKIEIRLMVGIGGGAPTPKRDIRLGDIVVNAAHNGKNSVLQYDYGKDVQDQSFQRTGVLGQPPQRLCGAVIGLKARHKRRGHQMEETIDSILDKNPNLRSEYARPSSDSDKLYKSTFVHPGNLEEPCTAVCENDPSNFVKRPARAGGKLVVHYGVIASANQVMKNAKTRDKLADEEYVLCFEMEAAGLTKNFPCLVIRGICDYSDTHKNKEWQGFAAMAAAAYAKDLLNELSPLHCSSPAPRSPELRNSVPEVHTESLIDERRKELLESLSFNQIDARQLTIKKAHAKTCKWVLKTSEYLDWQDHANREEHHGFLWIKGKPGTGKSTLMKFISTNYRKKMPQDTLITFFFNARGEQLEKSTVGMYRSLLFQLIDGLPQLRTILDFPTLMAPKVGPREWTIDLLKSLFEEAVLKLKSSSVTCFIDALDECDVDEIRDMVSFFKHISEETTSSQIQFQVCFSSRHYPQIKISKAVSLVLETEQGHEDDIVKYVSSELDIGAGKIAQEIRHDLQEKASGVFMWVVLVVDILNKEYEGGRIHQLRKRLREIPGDLDKLFREILTRGHHDREELLLCIQWVLFAKEPLRPEQLYFAILSGVEAESAEALSDWDPDDVTIDVMKRFIIDSSKGLTEITKAKDPKVQFIHESVRDFLLKHDGLSQICGDLLGNIEGQCHERLKRCCLNYLAVATAMEVGKSLPQTSSEQATELRDSAEKRLPFLRYAIQQVLYHSDTAEGSGVSQIGFLQTFDLRSWIVLDNLFEKHKIRRHTPHATLLYILAEHNMANLIKVERSKLDFFKIEGERYGAPILAALVTQSFEAVYAFLTSHKEASPKSLALSNLKAQYQQPKSMLGKEAREFTFSGKRSILSHAAELGDERVVALLLELGETEPDAIGARRRTPLSYAAEKGNLTMVDLLLKTDKVDVNHIDKGGLTPLLHAARGGHTSVVKLLLETGKIDINHKDKNNLTALSHASRGGHAPVIKLLLETGQVNTDAKDMHDSFLHALSFGHIQCLELLLATGKIDMNSRDASGQTLVSHAAGFGCPLQSLEFLLKYSQVEVDPTDNSGKTPLLRAAQDFRQGAEKIRLLLATGKVEVDSRDNSGRTPFSYAVENFSIEAEGISPLLATGKVEVDSRDNSGRTPLSYAAGNFSQGAEGIRLLLATGKVEVDCPDNSGRTPLSYAAHRGIREAVSFLLETGQADPSLKDNNEMTPYDYAADEGIRRIFHKYLIV